MFAATLAASAVFLCPAPGAADSIFGFDLYGQINPLVTAHDDGVTSQAVLADNANANSRVGLVRYNQWDSGAKTQLRFETGIGLRQSRNVSMGNVPLGHSSFDGNVRRVEYSVETRLGTFGIGQGSMATDTVSRADLSGTEVISRASVFDLAGAYAFRFDTGALSGITIRNAFPNYDGPRLVRVRYDTPIYKGLTLSAAYGWNAIGNAKTTDHYDAALRYDARHGPYRVVARAGYLKRIDRSKVTDLQHLVGSIAAEHNSGISVGLSLGKDLQSAAVYSYAKLGYKVNWLTVGQTALSLDFYSGRNTISWGSDANSVALAAVQNFDRRNLEVYAIYRLYDYTDTTARYRGASTAGLGLRWPF